MSSSHQSSAFLFSRLGWLGESCGSIAANWIGQGSLSKLGYCSRSRGFDLIRNGRVRLNGNIARNPESPVHFGKDRIQVDGVLIQAGPPIYLMMNKPRGIVTTASDEHGRDTVYAIADSGTMYAIDAEAGTEKWTTSGIRGFIAASTERLYCTDITASLVKVCGNHNPSARVARPPNEDPARPVNSPSGRVR